MEKGVYVKDIVPNCDLAGVFVISNPSLGKARNGPYWRITLNDASGSVEAKIWHPLSEQFEEMPSGKLARVVALSSLYKDQLQLAVNELEILDDEAGAAFPPSCFMPSSERDPEDMLFELRSGALEEFTHRPWRKLILGLLNDSEIRESLKVFPAAKSVHHAYAGGLLEHTLGVFNLCRKLADQYPQLDRQALLAGALLHDIGKIREFSGGFANDYTDEGRLVGHMLLGLELIGPFLARSGLEPNLKNHLRHLILSHHGQREFGAPCLPQTAEAFALHHADNVDAKMAQCRSLFPLDAQSGTWSPWQATLERRIYLPDATPQPDARRPRKQDGQCLSLLKE